MVQSTDVWAVRTDKNIIVESMHGAEDKAR